MKSAKPTPQRPARPRVATPAPVRAAERPAPSRGKRGAPAASVAEPAAPPRAPTAEPDSADLPPGWVSIRLGQLVIARKGKKPAAERATEFPGFVPYLDIQAVERGETSSYAEAATSRICTENDILVVWDGARSGWVGLGRPGAIGSTLMALQPQSGDRTYLFRWLQSAYSEINSNTRGTGIPHVDPEVIWNLEVPLPPLAEQRRIVAKLEELLGKVEASRQRLAPVPTLLKRFRQAVLAAACSGRLTADWREETGAKCSSEVPEGPEGFPPIPESWEWKTMEAVCSNIVDCPHSTPKWTSSGRICVRTTNFKPGFLDLSEVRYVSDATFDERIDRLRPQPGDVLYSREGGILGIACTIPPGVDLCLGQRMMLLRPCPGYSPALLMHWLNSPPILRRVQELTGGSASPHLNVRDIKACPTPIPPLPEQEEIVRRVEAMFAVADRLEARFEQARAQVDRLAPALLAKAFRGELVPQDPRDQTAPVLLERFPEKK